MSRFPARNDYQLVPIAGAPTVISQFRFAPTEINNATVEGPKLWKQLHEAENPNEEWFCDWLKRIPRYGCSCKNDFGNIIKDNQPRFDDWKRWAWEVHNTVNAKLGKPLYSWLSVEPVPKQWKEVDGARVGFVAANYHDLGGTETFHQTLVPRLQGVIGFASLQEIRGDVESLGVPCGQGLEAITSLSMQSDVVVSWNIDWTELQRPKRLVCVHHGSLVDSDGIRLCLQGDEIVCVNREVAEHVRRIANVPAYCIEPAVDPDRIKSQNTVETNSKKICLWSHRFHADKRPQLAIEIAKHLPDDWHMVLTGHRGEQIELNDRVTVLPPQHPGDWLSVASCFLSTTLFEGAGLSVAEAITAGVPVVSTPTGFASRPGIALTVPIDAHPREWAEAISSVSPDGLPSRDSFHLAGFLEAWEKVIDAWQSNDEAWKLSADEVGISDEVKETAIRFIQNLPLGFPQPEVSAEPDGHINLEWYRNPRRVLSVSIAPSNRLHWAALIGTESPRGAVRFIERIPKSILDQIARVFEG